jgi:hypothetical protein
VHKKAPLCVVVPRGLGAHREVTHRTDVPKDASKPLFGRKGLTPPEMFIEVRVKTPTFNDGFAARNAARRPGRWWGDASRVIPMPGNYAPANPRDVKPREL